MTFEGLDSLSLVVCHPFRSDSPGIILSMLPKRCRILTPEIRAEITNHKTTNH